MPVCRARLAPSGLRSPQDRGSALWTETALVRGDGVKDPDGGHGWRWLPTLETAAFRRRTRPTNRNHHLWADEPHCRLCPELDHDGRRGGGPGARTSCGHARATTTGSSRHRVEMTCASVRGLPSGCGRLASSSRHRSAHVLARATFFGPRWRYCSHGTFSAGPASKPGPSTGAHVRRASTRSSLPCARCVILGTTTHPKGPLT